MCIAIYKPMGVELPSNNIIKRCVAKNPDGAGYMVADGEQVTIKKGYMTMQEWMTEYKRLKRDPNNIDRAMVFHFRIATHGGTSKEMCQPFPFSRSVDELTARSTRATIGIAHNGIISMTSHAKTISDTALFIRNYLPYILQDGAPSIEQLEIIEECISGSRMAILYANGECDLVGDWHEHNGCFYSNKGFEKPSYYTQKSRWTWNNYNYDYDDYYSSNYRYYKGITDEQDEAIDNAVNSLYLK